MANNGDLGYEDETKRLREETERLREQVRRDEEGHQGLEERIQRIVKEQLDEKNGHPYLLTRENDKFGHLVKAWELLWAKGKATGGKKEQHLYQDTLFQDGQKVSHLIKELSRTERLLYKRDIYDEEWDALHSKDMVDTKAFVIWGQPGIGMIILFETFFFFSRLPLIRWRTGKSLSLRYLLGRYLLEGRPVVLCEGPKHCLLFDQKGVYFCQYNQEMKNAIISHQMDPNCGVVVLLDSTESLWAPPDEVEIASLIIQAASPRSGRHKWLKHVAANKSAYFYIMDPWTKRELAEAE